MKVGASTTERTRIASSLQLMEQWLTPYFRSSLRIIGEIPFTFTDIEEMGKLVQQLIAQLGLSRATLALTQKYPLAFITLMSGFAAFNTQANYWEAFSELIGQHKQGLYNYKWHQHFVRLAKAHGLKVFEFADDPTPYVTSIRFQGGIPAYSLPDYFEKLVLPAVERSSLQEIEPQQALAHLLAHVYLVDSPVLDFLRNSGELGVEFFGESCRLARHALQHHGEILTPDQVDLPQYVVRAFEAFLEHREDAKQHWRKPFLQAAPYSEDTAVNLFIPRQEISIELAASRLSWNITYLNKGVTETRICNPVRSRQSVIIYEESIAIPEPIERIEVSLNAVGVDSEVVEKLRRWNLPLLPSDMKTPLVAFNGDGIQLSSTRQLPAEALYLLIPVDAKITCEGDGRLIEECIALEGAWKSWKMELWDLSQVWTVQLVRQGRQLGEVIPVQGLIAQPELVGGHLFQFQDLEEPLYTSSVPSLRIPISSGSNPQARLANWQVHVRSLWEADPAIDRTIRLSNYAEQVEIRDDRGIFPLSYLLGNQPAGIYEIRAVGPRGLSAEFRVRLWPKLMVHGHNMQLARPSGEAKPSEFMLRLQDGAACTPQAGSEGVKITQAGELWKVIAPPQLNRVLLDLTAPVEGGGAARVPVSIPLPRLRWGLATGKEGETLTWGQTLIHRSIDQLLQAGNSALHVEMYGLGNMFYDLKLRLVELADQERVIQEARLSRTDFTRDWLRTSLGQFADSIRVINSLGQFELFYSPRGNIEAEVRIPLLEISRRLDIRDVALVPLSETEWKLTWQEPRPLKNRRVMLLPAWQPWQKPWEYKIPNNARGEFRLKQVAIPSARYHLYFYILPDYEDPLSEPPEGATPFTIDLCTIQQRILALPRDSAHPNEKFRNLIELAVIHDTIGDGDQRDYLLSEAAKCLIHLTNLVVLTGSLKWMQDKDINQPIKSFFFNSMFHFQIVNSMLRSYNIYDPSLREYLSYASKVKNIPTDSAKLLLKLVDDPIAIASCITNLIKKKDEELPGIIVKMMSEARLSKRDALELLSADPAWAIEKIANLKEDAFTSSLIAGLLPKIARDEAFAGDSRISDWMVRAIPYVEDNQILFAYLRHLFTISHPSRLEHLMKAYADSSLSEGEVMDILSLNPKASIQLLESAPDDADCQRWLYLLCVKYPSIAGIVTQDSQLLTPFGVAKVDQIEDLYQGQVNNVRLGDRNCILNVVVGDGGERIRVFIDYHNMTINVKDETHVWKCGWCNFVHPDQRKVMKHASQKHVSLQFSIISLPITFKPEEIQIVTQNVDP